LIYASVAALAGTALAVVLTPVAGILRVASAGVLILIGAWGLYQLRRSPNAAEGREVPTQSFLQTYAMVLGLTLLNPLTVTYFAALILGMNDCARAKHLSSCGSNASPLLFVVGAFLASLSWQSLLAGIGALAHRHLPPRFRVVTSVVGNLVIVGMGIAILLRVM
jgi:arginine exporter protein ArgO